MADFRIIVIIIVILVLLSRIYYRLYRSSNFIDSYKNIPEAQGIDIGKHSKKNPILILQYGTAIEKSSKMVSEYAKKNGFDYMTNSYPSHWQLLIILFQKFRYDYILFVPPNVYIHDMGKNIIDLLRQAGDTDMILTRNETNFNTVNIEVGIFRYSDWTLYKLRQFFFEKELYLDIILDQVYSTYQQKTLAEFKDILDIGIPYMLTNICIFNEHVLLSDHSCLFRRIENININLRTNPIFPWDKISQGRFTTIETIPNVDISIPSKKIGKIPKIIFQTMESNLVLQNIKQCIDQIRKLNPDYRYYYFSSYDCRKFIKIHYNHLLEVYDRLLPGAYKADFWRYCILHKYGGFYLDCRMLVYASFDTIIQKQTEFMSCVDVNQNMVYQAILGAIPNSKFLKIAIDLCVDNITKRKNDIGDLGITGPKVMGNAINKVLKRTINEDLTNLHNDKIVLLRWDSFKYPKYLELNNSIFACHKYTKLMTDEEANEETKYWIMLSGKEHYSVLYNHNRIYKFDLSVTDE